MKEYDRALALYKDIHKIDPENIECLRYLCDLCKERHDQDYPMYSRLLNQTERAQEAYNSRYLSQDVNVEGEPMHGGPSERGPTETPSVSPLVSPKTPKKMSMESNAPPDIHIDERRDKGRGINMGKLGDDDDWGEGSLGDDLLP